MYSLLINYIFLSYLRVPRPSWALGWAHKPKNIAEMQHYLPKVLGNAGGRTVCRFQIGKCLKVWLAMFTSCFVLVSTFLGVSGTSAWLG